VSAGRVTGVGGVFVRSHDPKALTDWYKEHLGFPVSDHGTMFMWSDEVPKGTGMTIWSAFPDNTNYFGKGSRQAVMLNLRVDDMDALTAKLAAADIAVEKGDDASYGKFAWITDPDGNRVELWQPLPEKE